MAKNRRELTFDIRGESHFELLRDLRKWVKKKEVVIVKLIGGSGESDYGWILNQIAHNDTNLIYAKKGTGWHTSLKSDILNVVVLSPFKDRNNGMVRDWFKQQALTYAAAPAVFFTF